MKIRDLTNKTRKYDIEAGIQQDQHIWIEHREHKNLNQRTTRKSEEILL